MSQRYKLALSNLRAVATGCRNYKTVPPSTLVRCYRIARLAVRLEAQQPSHGRYARALRLARILRDVVG